MSAPLPEPAAPDDPLEEEIACDLFVEALFRRHGYDFRGYGRASLKRRVRALATARGMAGIAELIPWVLQAPDAAGQVVAALSVPVSEFFRDPDVFRALRERVFPALASYPAINIWHAGCARGEEVYSLAILLTEAGLYERCRIYATDMSEPALKAAREGIYPAKDMAQIAARYREAGGARTFSDYVHARYDFLKLDASLVRNVTFAAHNLVTDGVFLEAHLILCRNVLIYFSDPLQDRALGLFADSLVRGGYLCIGTRENIRMAPAANRFQVVCEASRLFRRKAGA